MASTVAKVALKFARDHIKIGKRTYATRALYEMIRTEIRQVKRYIDEAAARSCEMETAITTLQLLFVANQIGDLEDPSLLPKIQKWADGHQWGTARIKLTDVLSNSQNPIFQVQAVELLTMMYTLEMLASILDETAFEDVIGFLLRKLFRENTKFKIEKEIFTTTFLPRKLDPTRSSNRALRDAVKKLLQTVIYCFTLKTEESQDKSIERCKKVIKVTIPDAFKKLENWNGFIKWLYDWEDTIEVGATQADFKAALTEGIGKRLTSNFYIVDVVPTSNPDEETTEEGGKDHEIPTARKEECKGHEIPSAILMGITKASYQLVAVALDETGASISWDAKCFTCTVERIPHLPRLLGVKTDGSDWLYGYNLSGARAIRENKLVLPLQIPPIRLDIQNAESTRLEIDRKDDSNFEPFINTFALDNHDFIVEQIKVDGVKISMIDEVGETKINEVAPWRKPGPYLSELALSLWRGLGRTFAWRDTRGIITIGLVCDDGLKICSEGVTRPVKIPEIYEAVSLVEHPSRFLILTKDGKLLELFLTTEEGADAIDCTVVEIDQIEGLQAASGELMAARAVANGNDIAIHAEWERGHWTLHFVQLVLCD